VDVERFGRYELIKKIATGGMAEIFLARQAGLEGFEKLLVLKRILPHLAENEDLVEMFLREARVAAHLNHPNIIQIYDLGRESGAYFIAMEYLHGQDARKVWRRSEKLGSPIPIPLVARIVMDAAAGLDHAHKKADPQGHPLRIIHRDVSPHNILLSFEGAVKVVDFGIAKAADQASKTRSGVLKGKYSYMSPEQAAGKEIDQRTDQFALGIVLWELLTLKRLFKRGSDVQTLAAVTECAVATPWETNPRVPRPLGEIALKALAHDPAQRYRDLSEMQMALEAWIVESKQPCSPPHLAAWLGTLYSDQLAKEQEEGLPVLGDPQEPSSSSTAERRRSGASQVIQQIEKGTAMERPARARQRASKPGVAKAALFAVAALVVLAGAAALWLSQTRKVAAAGPTPAGAAVGAIRVTSSPPGATLVVDAKETGKRTPATIPNLSLGEHTVILDLAGHQEATQTVRLEREAEIVAVNVELKPGAAAIPPGQPAAVEAATTVRLETSPPGAEVQDGPRLLGQTPLDLRLTPDRAALSLTLTKKGFEPLSYKVVAADGPTVRLKLTPQAGRAPTPANRPPHVDVIDD
jgi:serine/threonine protein kinase